MSQSMSGQSQSSGRLTRCSASTTDASALHVPLPFWLRSPALTHSFGVPTTARAAFSTRLCRFRGVRKALLSCTYLHSLPRLTAHCPLANIFVLLSDYPSHPPSLRFTSDMWHPNGEQQACLCTCCDNRLFERVPLTTYRVTQSTRTGEYASASCTHRATTLADTSLPASAGRRYRQWRPFWLVSSPC